jgi:hypothetical protein
MDTPRLVVSWSCRCDEASNYGSVVLRCPAVLTACRCQGKAAATVTAVALVVVVAAALLLLVGVNMVRDIEAPVHLGDFLKVLVR